MEGLFQNKVHFLKPYTKHYLKIYRAPWAPMFVGLVLQLLRVTWNSKQKYVIKISGAHAYPTSSGDDGMKWSKHQL